MKDRPIFPPVFRETFLNLNHVRKTAIRMTGNKKIFFKLCFAAFLCYMNPVYGSGASIDHPLYEEELDRAVRHLLAMRFEDGEELIQDWINRNPGKPAGYFFKAAAISARIYLEPPDSDIKGLEKDLKKTLRNCNKTAKNKRSRAESRFEGTLYIGSSYGLEALLAMLKKNYLVMAPLTKETWSYLKEAASLDPEYYDTYFGLGSYFYIIDNLHIIAKSLALLFGFEGDSEKGLAYLRLAGERGLYARDASLIMLMNLYSKFETPDSSICNMARDLYERYPDNPMVHWRYGDILFRLEDYEQARKIYQEVIDRISSDYRFYRNRMFTEYLIAYRLDMCEKNLGRKEQAIQRFEAILANSKITPKWVVSATYLACGEIYLDQNNEELARKNLKEALKYKDDDRGYRRKAKSMLKELKK